MADFAAELDESPKILDSIRKLQAVAEAAMTYCEACENSSRIESERYEAMRAALLAAGYREQP